MNTTLAVGSKIRNYRQLAGLTQEQLAEKSDLHHTYIGQIERGEKNLTIATLGKILTALNITYEDFFTGFDGKSQTGTAYEQCVDLIGNLDSNKQAKIFKLLMDILSL